jgi:hypothetical protein
MRRLFEWLGVRRDEKVMNLVGLMSRERFAELAPGQLDRAHPQSDRSAGRPNMFRRGLARVRRTWAGHRLGRVTGLLQKRGAAKDIAAEFAEAMRQGADRRLVELTEHSLVFELKSGEGDLRTTGDSAREALLTVAAQVFDRKSSRSHGPSIRVPRW